MLCLRCKIRGTDHPNGVCEKCQRDIFRGMLKNRISTNSINLNEIAIPKSVALQILSSKPKIKKPAPMLMLTDRSWKKIENEISYGFIEDIIRENTTVYISSQSPFLNDMKIFCEKYGIGFMMINCGSDYWYRDYFVKTNTELYIAETPESLPIRLTHPG